MANATNADQRRCTADTKRGRCRVTRGLNAEGLCSMHSGATDPRELGRLSGKRRREPNPERVPASLRAELRKLDPAVVRGAIEQALAGANESARVSAVKLLADVDAFSRDGQCPRCAEADGEAVGARERLLAAKRQVRRRRRSSSTKRGPAPIGMARLTSALTFPSHLVASRSSGLERPVWGTQRTRKSIHAS
jgi:hypothetical protein